MEEKIFEICDAMLGAIAGIIEQVNKEKVTQGEWAEVCATMACSMLVMDEESQESKKLKYGKMLHHIAEWIEDDLPEMAAMADAKMATPIIQTMREFFAKEGELYGR